MADNVYPEGHPLALARMLPTNIGDPEPEPQELTAYRANELGSGEPYGLRGRIENPDFPREPDDASIKDRLLHGKPEDFPERRARP